MKEYFRTARGVLYQGNALEVLKQLPDESVDLVVTSPPYWAKRDYGDGAFTVFGGDPDCDHEWVEQEIGLQHENRNNVRGKQDEVVGKKGTVRIKKYNKRTALVCKKCGAWYGQLGLEPTPQMFVEHLVEIFREVKRVLKPTGSLFVNIDDTWVGGGHGYGVGANNDPKWNGRSRVPKIRWNVEGMPKKKSLALVPELFAVKMVYEEGWILREKIIWSKKVHFYKEHTTKGNAMPESVKDRFSHTWEYVFHFTKRPKYYFDLDAVKVPLKEESVARAHRGLESWKLNGTPKGMTVESKLKWHSKVLNGEHKKANPGDVVQINVRPFKDAHFAVYPPDLPEMLIKVASPENGVVLDPFAGAGTTLVVAEKLGRRWIGIEINTDYCEIIKRRFEKELGGIANSKPLDEFMGVKA